MSGPHLVYVADPMCSWCWGFSPVIEVIRRRYGGGLPIRLLMGGLRPQTSRAMDAAGGADSVLCGEPRRERRNAAGGGVHPTCRLPVI